MALKNLKVDVIAEMKKVVKNPKKQRALTPILKQPDVKLEIGRRVVDDIVNRTLGGFDKNERKFKKYSSSYRKSDVFKIYKGSKRNVDLKLTGAMLSSIDVVKITRTGFEIGFVRNMPKQKLKAQGHVEGANFLPIRDFWGLPDRENMEKLIDTVVRDTLDASLENQLLLFDQLDNLDISVASQEPLVFGFEI